MINVFIILMILCSLLNFKKFNKKRKFHDYYLLGKGEEPGSWETFLNCPKIFLTDDNGKLVDLGSAKIYPKEIISDYNEKIGEITDKHTIIDEMDWHKDVGILFEFKKSPNENI